ncbi:hypothetical protein BDN70DRAFT_874484 [Pholiota conissans]|uniref:Uncharacterized protein n=1 Tax=Pholiota conissans TaxID=109636 RepID=A0A9P5Z782_9AGAR|nr:hypothetical protein BDN70DRAFT_874484 [Pholiota conissans]
MAPINPSHPILRLLPSFSLPSSPSVPCLLPPLIFSILSTHPSSPTPRTPNPNFKFQYLYIIL